MRTESSNSVRLSPFSDLIFFQIPAIAFVLLFAFAAQNTESTVP